MTTPFRSRAQERWMHANDPDMAERWEKHTTSEQRRNLPEKVSKKSIDRPKSPAGGWEIREEDVGGTGNKTNQV
jgi:hypothetical protein